MKKHLIPKICLISLCAVILLALAAFLYMGALFAPQLKAADSIKKLEERLYMLEYEGDYGFKGFLDAGGAESDADMADYISAFLSHGFWKPETEKMTEAGFGCSTISVKDAEGNALFGRNYDWTDCDAMIVHTKPSDGYESIATCCLDFLGFGEGWKPESTTDKFLALAAVYVPLDGMNEKGLCVADLVAGDSVETHQDTERPDLTVTPAIRLLLDYAADVEEAVELLSQYDMNSSIGTAHHLSVSDASGRSVVIEYIDGGMYVTETKAVTNHYLTDCYKQGTGSEQSHIRFDTLTRKYAELNGVTDENGVLGCLKSVCQANFPDSDEKTQWSIVYNTSALTAEFYFRENYSDCYRFTLKTDGNGDNR